MKTLAELVSRCPMGFVDGRVIVPRSMQERDMVEWLKELVALAEAKPTHAPASGWQLLDTLSGEARVRRFRVPGGWLYQVEQFEKHDPGREGEPTQYVEGWLPPVFVADSNAPIVERPRAVTYEKPERTAYRGHDGVYHPAPSSSDYERHAMLCQRCSAERDASALRERMEAGHA